MALTGQVLGNVGATSLTVTDPSDATNPFQSFDLSAFQAFSLPAGVKATVEYTTNGSTWVAVPGRPVHRHADADARADPPRGDVVGRARQVRDGRGERDRSAQHEPRR